MKFPRQKNWTQTADVAANIAVDSLAVDVGVNVAVESVVVIVAVDTAAVTPLFFQLKHQIPDH